MMPRTLAASPRFASIRQTASRILGRGADLVFPPECLYCDADLDDGAAAGQQLCATCMARLTRQAPHVCRRCGIPLPELPEAEERCASCRAHSYRFSEVVSLGRYQDELREALLRGKQAAEQPLVAALVRQLARREADRLADWQIDCVAPIPMFWLRRCQRGADHAATIAEQLAHQMGVRHVRGLLRRRRNTFPQNELTPVRRVENMVGAFAFSRSYSLQNARVLLVDDIMTTGATANEASRVLLANGASDVFVAVLARADVSH